MPEQEYEIRNKQMLAVAAGLGIVSVLLFLWHDYQLRRANEEDQVEVLAFARDVNADEPLNRENLKRVKFPKRLVPTESRDEIVHGDELDSVVGLKINQDVKESKILRYSYLTAPSGSAGGPTTPKVGYQIVPLQVDRSNCPPSLSAGMYVDIMMTMPGMDDGTEPVMEMVLVKTVNGLGAVGATSRTIEAVGLEIRQADAAKFMTLKSNIDIKKLQVVIRNPDDKPKLGGFNAKLNKLIDSVSGKPEKS